LGEAAASWDRVSVDQASLGGPGEQTMLSVTAGGPGLVAVGYDISGGDPDAAVWLSSDGRTWTRVAHDESIFGGPGGQEMRSVTAGGPGLVAVGTEYTAWASSVHAAVWVSIDGYAWTRIPDDGSVFGGPDQPSMWSVAAGGSGLVAVGGQAVWVSVDGYAWSRIPLDGGIFGSDDMRSVTVGGPGLVAVGLDWSGSEGGGIAAAVWVSADGYAWTRVSNAGSVFHAPADGSMNLWSVTAGGPGLVAVGTVFGESRSPVVLVSADGYTWTRVLGNEAAFGDWMFMSAVTAGGPGLVAVGSTDEGVSGGAAVWVSEDGISWARVADDGGVFVGEFGLGMASVTPWGNGLVAVGGGPRSGPTEAGVWEAQPEDEYFRSDAAVWYWPADHPVPPTVPTTMPEDMSPGSVTTVVGTTATVVETTRSDESTTNPSTSK
jgi:hypothetical protein